MSLPLPDGTVYHTDISKEVTSKHKLFLTGVARASVSYNFSDRFYAVTSALLNDIQFNSASGVKMHMSDWVVNLTLGTRF